jgi:hypothetical protein
MVALGALVRIHMEDLFKGPGEIADDVRRIGQAPKRRMKRRGYSWFDRKAVATAMGKAMAS